MNWKKNCAFSERIAKAHPIWEYYILSRHPDLKPSTYEDSFEKAHAIPKTNDSHLILSNSVCF